jgi:hypothetical protein
MERAEEPLSQMFSKFSLRINDTPLALLLVEKGGKKNEITVIRMKSLSVG